MHIDDEGWLVAEPGEPAVKRYPTVRRTALAAPTPLGIVWHWTAGRGGPGFAATLARGAQQYRRRIDRPGSWHVLIAKDGGLHQSAPFTVGTWHVGKPGVIAGRRFVNINAATGGVELENAGRLRKLGTGWYCWPYWVNPGAPAYERRPHPGCAIDGARAIAVPGVGTFDAYPQAQVASASLMLAALVARYRWRRDVCAYGHVDFDPVNKEDPGPLWSKQLLAGVLDNIFGGAVAPAATAPSAQGA